MDFGTALSVAQTVFAALQYSELKQIYSLYGHETELEGLQATVSTVRDVLRDAESKQELTNEEQSWIQELADAVYDADDLLDEFITHTERNQIKREQKAIKKVCRFFSLFDPLVAHKMSREVKVMGKRLDAIATNHSRYGLTIKPVDYKPWRRGDSYSDVYAPSIIGREHDVKTIVGTLLDSNVQRHHVSFLSIVGIGGLGKTALAQLLYNDVRVQNAFPLRLWACVADHDQTQLEVDAILAKIFSSATDQKPENFTMDSLRRQLRQKLASTKYFLVLDDVWTEDRLQWRNLVDFFQGSHKGSWVMVTTRSRETAKIIEHGSTYELEGLSRDDSWHLFKREAFGVENSNPCPELIKIGQEIVEGCARVPLAIRVLGSFLFSQEEHVWLSLQKRGLANITTSKNGVVPILKLSYHHLQSPLKSCFSYCALFPKDFVINKEMLVNLWIAQGYVEPLKKEQRIEDAAQQYITILLQRCFFQDIVQDTYGEIISFKMHDLMHDIAQEVAGKDICITYSVTDSVDKKVRHLSLMRSETAGVTSKDDGDKCADYSFTTTHIRTYLHVGEWYRGANMDQSALNALLNNCKCLRVLDLSYQNIKKMPSLIGGLLHLRYLDLTGNRDLELLPKSIQSLLNLETLKLNACDRLQALPPGLKKLVKLRVLEIKDCYSLTQMPCGMGKLTCLQTLSQFVIGEANYQQWCRQLEDLQMLENLCGHLVIPIQFPQKAAHAKSLSTTKAYLMNKKDLTHINIRFDYRDWEVGGRMEYGEWIMNCLQPYSNLKDLELCGYHGTYMPSWTTSLPKLVRLHLENCKNIQYLPSPCSGHVPLMKVLELVNLQNLECIFESCATSSQGNSAISAAARLSQAESTSTFPSLQRLELHHLPNLKGWCKAVRDDHLQVGSSNNLNKAQLDLQCLPELHSLVVARCQELISLPLCPKVKDLSLSDYNKNLQIMRVSVPDLTHLLRCL